MKKILIIEDDPDLLALVKYNLEKHVFSVVGVDAVWGPGRAVTERTVDVYVLRLRQKLEVDPTNPKLIRSARGFDYAFEAIESEHGISVGSAGT